MRSKPHALDALLYVVAFPRSILRLDRDELFCTEDARSDLGISSSSDLRFANQLRHAFPAQALLNLSSN